MVGKKEKGEEQNNTENALPPSRFSPECVGRTERSGNLHCWESALGEVGSCGSELKKDATISIPLPLCASQLRLSHQLTGFL
jgi:hypothetical protein